MKRYSNLYDQIISIDNLSLAFDRATKHKKWRLNIQRCMAHKDEIIQSIHTTLKRGHYHTSKYKTKIIHEPKERIIYVLPFAPDRVVHHAIMRIIEPIFESKLIYDTYACRTGKGQIKASDRCLEYTKKYKYVLQLDISKFYPSINHTILKQQLCKIFKDKRLLDLLFEIIDSIEGNYNVPIGNFLSQWFGNIYLNVFDRFIIKQGFSKLVRYCDDILVFSDDKQALAELKDKAKEYLHSELELRLSRADIIKTTRGVKFLGYRHFPQGYRLLKKVTALRIKRRLKHLPEKLERNTIRVSKAKGQVASALGWLTHCNGYNLQQSLNIAHLCRLTNVRTDDLVKDVDDILETKEKLGVRVPISVLVNKPVVFYGAKICNKKSKEFLRIHFKLLDKDLNEVPTVYVSFTESKRLIFLLTKYSEQMPFTGKLIQTTKAYCLTSIRSNEMKGFPKHLNSKKDYLYIRAHFDRELWLPEYQKLLDSRFDWFFVEDLESKEQGIEDDTHKIVETTDTETQTTKYAQYEYRENPTAKIFRIGFTVAEVEELMNEE